MTVLDDRTIADLDTIDEVDPENDWIPVWDASALDTKKMAASSGGLPDGLYMDANGNVVFGEANIAAFPTDRGLELRDIWIDGTATFVPPAEGCNVHGLKLYGTSTCDASAMQSGDIVGCVFTNFDVTLGNDSGDSDLHLHGCNVVGSYNAGFGHATGYFEILSGGNYEGIGSRGPIVEVAAALTGVYNIQTLECSGANFEITGNAGVDVFDATFLPDSSVTHSSNTSKSTFYDCTVHYDCDVTNSSAGTGDFNVYYGAGSFGNLQFHPSALSTGDVTLYPRFGATISGEIQGVIDANITVNGSCILDINGCHSVLNIGNYQAERQVRDVTIEVTDTGAAGSTCDIRGVSGFGTIQIGRVGGVDQISHGVLDAGAVLTFDTPDGTTASLQDFRLAASSQMTVTLAVVDDFVDCQRIELGPGAVFAVSGGQVNNGVAGVFIVGGASVDQNGEDIVGMTVLDPTYVGTLSGANNGTFCLKAADVALDTLVD